MASPYLSFLAKFLIRVRHGQAFGSAPARRMTGPSSSDPLHAPITRVNGYDRTGTDSIARREEQHLGRKQRASTSCLTRTASRRPAYTRTAEGQDGRNRMTTSSAASRGRGSARSNYLATLFHIKNCMSFHHVVTQIIFAVR